MPGVPKKRTPWFILTITLVNMDQFSLFFSLLQQEIHDTQKLSYFSLLTFIMLPLYLAKQTLILVSIVLIFVDHAEKQIGMYSNG